MIVAAALIVGAALIWAARSVASEIAAARRGAETARAVELLQLFAPGIAAADADPRALLTWEPLARLARQVCPSEFARLDRAAGSAFPFGRDRLQAAHAKWTADWLAWERAHDAEYKLKAAEAEHETSAAGSALTRARVDAVEREKLERYQRRYEEYIRTAKALQALMDTGH